MFTANGCKWAGNKQALLKNLVPVIAPYAALAAGLKNSQANKAV
jgi:hypothetical protein